MRGLFSLYMKFLSYSFSLKHITYKIVHEIATLAGTQMAIKTPCPFLTPQI